MKVKLTLAMIAWRLRSLSPKDALLWVLVAPLLMVALADFIGPWAGILAMFLAALAVAKLLSAWLTNLDNNGPGSSPPPSSSSGGRKKKRPPGGGSGPSGGAPVFARLGPRPVLGAAAAKELPLGGGE